MLKERDVYTIPQIVEVFLSVSHFVHLSAEQMTDTLMADAVMIDDGWTGDGGRIAGTYIRAVRAGLIEPVVSPMAAYTAIEERHGCFCHLCGSVGRGYFGLPKHEEYLFRGGIKIDIGDERGEDVCLFSSMCSECRRRFAGNHLRTETMLVKMLEYFRKGAGRDILEGNRNAFAKIRFDARIREERS